VPSAVGTEPDPPAAFVEFAYRRLMMTPDLEFSTRNRPLPEKCVSSMWSAPLPVAP